MAHGDKNEGRWREREEEEEAKPEPTTTACSCYSGRGVSYVHFLFAENWALTDSIVTGCFLCAVLFMYFVEKKYALENRESKKCQSFIK